jgi:hypothetical protein
VKKDERAMQLLDAIQPPAQPKRFLQIWDRAKRVLRFGCGDGTKAIQVCSDRTIEEFSGPSTQTRLPKNTVKKFMAGESAPNPLSDVLGTLAAFLHFDDVRLYVLLAVWTTGTYFYSIFSHFGYLFLHSNKPRCGKTRTAEVVGHLAFEATGPLNCPTVPAIREIASEGGTALFDTLERWKQKESRDAAMEILDAGFRNGGTVAKMVQFGNGQWRKEFYPVYAPYMLAGIGKDCLTDTALDRSFVVEMLRKPTRIRKQRYFAAKCEQTCAANREQLYLAALEHAEDVAAAYESTELDSEVRSLGLNDRAEDIWKPLLAVAKVLGTPEMAEQLRGLAVEMSRDAERQDELRQLAVVAALRTVAGTGGCVRGVTQQIIDGLKTLTTVDCQDLHSVLKDLGFEEKSIRLTERFC